MSSQGIGQLSSLKKIDDPECLKIDTGLRQSLHDLLSDEIEEKKVNVGPFGLAPDSTSGVIQVFMGWKRIGIIDLNEPESLTREGLLASLSKIADEQLDELRVSLGKKKKLLENRINHLNEQISNAKNDDFKRKLNRLGAFINSTKGIKIGGDEGMSESSG